MALVAFGVVVASASAASAHAVVVSSQPGDRERLTSAPQEVSITFSEAVSPDLGGITVLNAKGDRVDNGVTTQPKPEMLATKLNGDLPEGTYVTNYRVISADGHPVNGTIVWSVGTAIDDAGASGVTEKSNPAFEVLNGIGRFGAYLGGLLAAGLAFFAWFVHDQAADRSRFPRIVVIAAIVGVVGQSLILLSQAALASGSGLTAIFTPSLFTKVVSGSLGFSSAALVVGLIACVIAMKVRGALLGQSLAFYGFVTVAVSYALWGHDIESEMRWLSISTDVLHTATAALWFGGLVGLGLVLVGRSRAAARAAGAGSEPAGSVADGGGGSSVAVLERVETRPSAEAEAIGAPDASPADTVGIVIRFSTLATVAIVLLGLAGGVLAWLELGSLSALVSTSYGRALIVKLVIVAAIAGVAVYNHFRLLPIVLGETETSDEAADIDDVIAKHDQATVGADDEPEWEEPDFALPEWKRLLKTVRLEAIGIVAVLMVTAVLVNLTPGKTASGDLDAGPYNATKVVGKGKVDLTIAPAKAGSNSMHITYLSADNRAAELAQSVTVEMSLPEKGVGPLTANAPKAGLGHFIVLSTPAMSIPGTWKVTLVSRLGEFEQERTDFEVPIGEPASS